MPMTRISRWIRFRLTRSPTRSNSSCTRRLP